MEVSFMFYGKRVDFADQEKGLTNNIRQALGA